MAITRTSRHRLTDTISLVNATTGELIRPRFVDIRPRVTGAEADDRFVTVTSKHTWGSLGLSYLNDAGGWWAIADLSNVVDPFEELTVGTQLRVPTVDRYLFRILPGDPT